MNNSALIGFDAAEFRKRFHQLVADLSLSLKQENDDQSQASLEVIHALDANIDIMQRVDVDYESTGNASLSVKDINQIGDYAISLIGELVMIAANRGLQETMIELGRLSMPVAGWISRHNGKILQLDMLVNTLASYANEITEPEKLEQLSDYIESIMPAIEDDVKKDLEAGNPMRPWRILNLNWGIVATRSHNSEIIEKVYSQLIKNIPDDISGFMREAMQQMDVIGYPDHVRKIVSRFYTELGYDQQLH